jgi:prophage regulatory protein
MQTSRTALQPWIGGAIDAILREPEVLVITRLSRVTRWRMERAGQFPKKRRIGPHSVGWLKSEIVEWLASREAA